MINIFEVNETNKMIEQENLDVRTITMGISLLSCCDRDVDRVCEKVYNRITTLAKNLVPVGQEIEKEYGIPIVNKRISVTPISLIGGAACHTPEDFVKIAKTLDAAAKEVGVNFIGGFGALVHKGFSAGDRRLIESIPRALAETDIVCSSVNIGATKAGLNMDAVKLMGEAVKKVANYRHLNAERRKMAGDVFVETSVWESVRSACDFAITYNRPVRVIGDTQIGKTFCFREYMRRAKCTVFYMQVPAAPSFWLRSLLLMLMIFFTASTAIIISS